jgi:hypothetical protein
VPAEVGRNNRGDRSLCRPDSVPAQQQPVRFWPDRAKVACWSWRGVGIASVNPSRTKPCAPGSEGMHSGPRPAPCGRSGFPGCFALSERAEVFGGELRPVWLGICKAFLEKSLYCELVPLERAGRQAGDTLQMLVGASQPSRGGGFRHDTMRNYDLLVLQKLHYYRQSAALVRPRAAFAATQRLLVPHDQKESLTSDNWIRRANARRSRPRQ